MNRLWVVVNEQDQPLAVGRTAIEAWTRYFDRWAVGRPRGAQLASATAQGTLRLRCVSVEPNPTTEDR